MSIAEALWVVAAQDAIAADCHHRHGLDWYRLDAHTALRLARLFLETPGTYTHSTVAIPEQERLLEARGLIERITAEKPTTAEAERVWRRRDSVDTGVEHVKTTDAPMDDRWAALADMNGMDHG